MASIILEVDPPLPASQSLQGFTACYPPRRGIAAVVYQQTQSPSDNGVRTSRLNILPTAPSPFQALGDTQLQKE
jgi:hypothetical protein